MQRGTGKTRPQRPTIAFKPVRPGIKPPGGSGIKTVQGVKTKVLMKKK